MFQTEIIHFIQSFASDELTAFMRFITDIGYQQVLLLILCVLILAIDLKKGFILSLVLLWTGLATFVLKEYFDLPRPFHVDNTVLFLDGALPDESTFEFSKRGASSFWEGLPSDVLEVTRASEGVENGFPSGHSSVAIAFWGALIFLFRKKWLTVICISLMILIPFSRMYLGVHFLADVLGGILLGGLILGLFYLFLLKPKLLHNFMTKDRYTIGLNALTVCWIICPLLFLFLLPSKLSILVALMIGLGLGFLLLGKQGIPKSEASWPYRLGRLLLGVTITALTVFAFYKIGTHLGWVENAIFMFAYGIVISLSFIWVSIEASIRFGWFIRTDDQIED